MDLEKMYKLFPEQKDFIVWLEGVRWGNNLACPYCGANKGISRQAGENRKARLHCNNCKKSYSVTVDTAMQGSKMDLRKWVLTAHILSLNSDISYRKLSALTGVTAANTFTIAKKIRQALTDEDIFLKNILKNIEKM